MCQKFSKDVFLNKYLTFFESTLCNQQCCFHKGLSTQQCVLVLLEKGLLIGIRLLVPYQQTYQRHLIVLIMSY